MSPQSGRIKNIVIVGGGTAGWMAAAALGRLFRNNSDMSVTLIESEAIGTVGVGEATIPPIREYLKFLKITEPDFMRRTSATYKLAIKFENWETPQSAYWHPFGELGPNIENWPLYQHWLKARAHKKDCGALMDHSICIKLAEQNKFQFPKGDPYSPLRNSSYAFHLDAVAFAGMLREYAEERAVKRIEGKVVKVHQHENGDIAALQLEGDRRVEGDFFIDCTGFYGLLIEKTLNAGYDDWSEYLPCDRAYAAPTPSAGDLYPYTHSIAQKAGWRWKIPLQSRMGNGYVFSTRFTTEEDAREEFLSALGEAPLAEPRLLKFTGGRRKEVWKKNCLSLGLASGFLEPLESTSIHMIFTGLFKFLDSFPEKEFSQAIINKYNKNVQHSTEEIRDFIILHYCLTRRDDTEFWNYCRTMPLPASLEDRIEMFRLNGRILSDSDALFRLVSWISIYDGMGVTPNSYDPLVDCVPEQAALDVMARIRAGIKQTVQESPRHATVLESQIPA